MFPADVSKRNAQFLSYKLPNFVLFCFLLLTLGLGVTSNPEQTTLCCICMQGWGCPAGLQPSGQRCRLEPEGFPLPTGIHLDPSTVLKNHGFSALPTFSALSFNHLGCSYFGTICSLSSAKAPTRGSLCRVQWTWTGLLEGECCPQPLHPPPGSPVVAHTHIH